MQEQTIFSLDYKIDNSRICRYSLDRGNSRRGNEELAPHTKGIIKPIHTYRAPESNSSVESLKKIARKRARFGSIDQGIPLDSSRGCRFG